MSAHPPERPVRVLRWPVLFVEKVKKDGVAGFRRVEKRASRPLAELWLRGRVIKGGRIEVQFGLAGFREFRRRDGRATTGAMSDYIIHQEDLAQFAKDKPAKEESNETK